MNRHAQYTTLMTRIVHHSWENFAIFTSQIYRIAFKLSIMGGEILKYIQLKLQEMPPWVGENVEIYTSKWLELPLNGPP